MSKSVVLPSYKDRMEQFRKVKTRILSILLDYPDGLSKGDIELHYISRFRHVATIGNRLRELRKEGEVQSFPCLESKRLIWKLTEEWKVKE